MAYRNAIWTISASLGLFVVTGGIELVAVAPPAARTVDLPDLTIDANRLQNSVVFRTKTFRQGDCAVQEECVSGLGRRTLMRFDTVTPNLGPGDLFLGNQIGRASCRERV